VQIPPPQWSGQTAQNTVESGAIGVAGALLSSFFGKSDR